jgi:tetratricopeptide (TPR) repeat protein
MFLPVPEFLQPLIGNSVLAALLLYGGLALPFLIALLVVWLVFGFGPRRRRGLKRARQRLKEGAWEDAMERVGKLRRIGLPSKSWQKTFDKFEAECLQGAARIALDEANFEQALEFSLKAARLRGRDDLEVRAGIQSTMLTEVRRLFSVKHGTDTQEIRDLISRTMRIQSPCREASFWQAMCDLREGHSDQALVNLHIARTGQARPFLPEEGPSDISSPGSAPPPTSPFLDPPLYIGAIHLIRGQPKEALRSLTEANRMDPGCPIVTLQLGAAMIAAGGDTNFAVRALQKALGPRGLGQWENAPQRAWVEAFPEHRSYVRKLASEARYTCPLWGSDLTFLIRQGSLALAQGQYKLGNYQDAANLFDRALKEGALSLPVLRGLGLSLARLGRFDDAFKHLRTAHEMGPTRDRVSAGYLALCGACGKPSSEEDRRQNLAWAVGMITQFNAPGDAEWAAIASRVFAEAREHDVPVGHDEQLYLCEHLLSVHATDAQAAGAYHHLMATYPALMHREYAWLYCRADEQHDVGGDHALELYAQTFSDPAAARAFYEQRQWDFDAVEIAYLRRAAQLAPGRFPEPLGADYAPRGEQLLLQRSEILEQAGQPELAMQMIDVLVKLSPANTRAIDRSAALHYHAGHLEEARGLLARWHEQQPDDPLPLVREAVLLHQQGLDQACRARLQMAMERCAGRRRANVAFLGARMLLQSYVTATALETSADDASAPGLAAVEALLQDCLQHDPNHAEALWCLAAVRWMKGNTRALAELSGRMKLPDVADPRFHYLAALAHLMGDDPAAVLEACGRALQHAAAGHERRNGEANGVLDLGVESRYLAALAQVRQGDRPGAIESLLPLSRTPASPTVAHAQAQLGAAQFAERRHQDTIQSWQALEPGRRQALGLSEPLAQTMFVSALEDLLAGRYEQSAEKFRQAGRLGCRDRRLGPLLLLALFKAGQQALYGPETAPVGSLQG